MSFRPNPSALLKPTATDAESGNDSGTDDDQPKASTSTGGVYRPPRLAAVPYTEPVRGSRKTKEARAPKTNTLLTDYALTTGSTLPTSESVTGLHTTNSSRIGPGGSKGKSLAQEQNEYEESAFTRLPLRKTDLKRREREEREDALGLGGWSDVLGGIGGSGGFEVGGGGGSSGGGAWEKRKRGTEGTDGGKPKKGKFERDMGKKGKSKKRR